MDKNEIKVLAVDDSQDILFAISAICEIEGWQTLTTTDAREAVDIVRSERPDIVLVDYHMPRMDGIETVRCIREVDANIPILVLTIESSRQIADSFFEAGADDFALKPIKPVDLISRIRVHLRAAGVVPSQSAVVSVPAERKEAPAPKESAPIPQEEYVKGISPLTLSIICNFLHGQSDYLTINEISTGCGVAYQTAYRYLTYLAGEGSISVLSEYGRQGRPKQKYKWKDN